MKDVERRVALIEALGKIHPAIVQQANPLIAHYVGGMLDSGDLDFRYCLFHATIEELEQTLLYIADSVRNYAKTL